MQQFNTLSHHEEERERERDDARAEMMRIAREQGIGIVTDFDSLLGELIPEDQGDDNVDRFLLSIREWRDTPSNRSVE
jgi:hypothetical protein